MAITVTPYNHTAKYFADSTFAPTDTYIINLYSVFDFDPSDTTKSAAETGATQLPSLYGYTQDTKTLASVAVSATGSPANDAKFDAADISWTASGGAIGPASYAVIFNTTATDDPPVLIINFGEAKQADSGTPFNITWNAAGIITWTVT